MYVKISGYKGKKYLSIVEGYRIDGKVRHKTIKKLGYIEDLKKQFDGPISHFKEIAKNMTKENITEYTIKDLNS